MSYISALTTIKPYPFVTDVYTGTGFVRIRLIDGTILTIKTEDWYGLDDSLPFVLVRHFKAHPESSIKCGIPFSINPPNFDVERAITKIRLIKKKNGTKIFKFTLGDNFSVDIAVGDHKSLAAAKSKLQKWIYGYLSTQYEVLTGYTNVPEVTGETILSKLRTVFPGIDTRYKCVCPTHKCGGEILQSVSNWIIHLNDTHKWEIGTQIADWLESIDVDLQAVPRSESPVKGSSHLSI